MGVGFNHSLFCSRISSGIGKGICMSTERVYELEWTGNVRTIGRVFVYNDVLWMSFSGCGIEFTCSGGFRAMLVADSMIGADDADIHYARYAVYRDGQLILDDRLKENEASLGLKAEGTHTFRIIKLSESSDSSMGIRDLRSLDSEAEDETHGLRPTDQPELKIEIVGNSITCGYGVEGDLTQTYSTATENVSLAWSYLTAGRMSADYSIVSKSGAGLISGYTGDGVRNSANILSDYYDKMGCSMGSIAPGVKPQSFDYDFSYEPDVIVVNSGTNDISFVRPLDEKGELRISEEEHRARRREFYAAYKAFIQHIRERNPFSKILCTLGVMGTALNGEVETVVRELNAAGDSRVFWLALADQDAVNDGYGTDYHPSRITQVKLTDAVVNALKEIL